MNRLTKVGRRSGLGFLSFSGPAGRKLLYCGSALLFVVWFLVLDAIGVFAIQDVYSLMRVSSVVLLLLFAWYGRSLFRFREETLDMFDVSLTVCAFGIAVFLWVLPSMRTSDYKEFYLLSERLKHCTSLDDPVVQDVFSRYRVDRYSDEPDLVRIRFPDSQDCSQILLRLGTDGRTILHVEFDPD